MKPGTVKNYKAILFDLNGTMVDDMSFHIDSWHTILTGLGAHMTREETKKQCYGKNHELLERVFPGRFNDEEKDKMEIEKETRYQNLFRPLLKLIDGLEAFMQHAHDKGIKMGIGSAAIMFNIDFVIDGLNIRHYFDAIVSANDVKISKPDPETWLQCAAKMDIDPADCLVFEDAPKGVESAQRAGMDVVVITTMHEEAEFAQYKNIVAFIKNYQDKALPGLV